MFWRFSLRLQSSDCVFEMKDFPESDPEIQNPDATHGAAHPAGRNNGLQSLNASLLRSI